MITDTTPIWKMQKFLQKRFAKKAKVTKHFMVRLYDRFEYHERMRLIVELNELFKSGMHLALLELNKTHAKVEIQNSFLCVQLNKGNNLVLKTIFRNNEYD